MATAISAKDVGALRERTGAGMMDCKKALEETGGNMDKAVELLRSTGAAKAEKRAGPPGEGRHDRELHPPQRQDRRAGGAQLRDRLRRAHRDFQQLGKWIAEHVAAAAPLARRQGSGAAEKVESRASHLHEQVKAEGKPEHMIEKIVEGKIQAFYKDVALMHQAWVREPKKTIGDLVKEVSAKTGENMQVRRFVRYQLGE